MTKSMMYSDTVHQMFGVFYKHELECVEFTMQMAKSSAENLSATQAQDGSTIRNIPSNRTIRPVFVLETDLGEYYLYGARRALTDAIKKLREETAKKEKTIQAAVEAKDKGYAVTIPEHYWEDHRKAWINFEAAKRIVEALEKEAGNMKFSYGG